MLNLEKDIYEGYGYEFEFLGLRSIQINIEPTKASIGSSRIKYECKECHEEFRNKIALTTHSYSHNRKYLENTEYFDINSSQNMKDFYITDKAGKYIEDIDEAINNSLEEIKNCYQYRKVKSFKNKITVECEHKKRTKEEVKTTKNFFNTDYIVINAIYENGDFTQCLNLEKKYMRVMAITLSFSE